MTQTPTPAAAEQGKAEFCPSCGYTRFAHAVWRCSDVFHATPPPASVEQFNEERAMGIIARAAILLETDGDGCLTPGAEWETKVKGDGTISVKVILPTDLAAKLNEQLSAAYKHPYIDAVLHNYMQVAVWKILEGKLS